MQTRTTILAVVATMLLLAGVANANVPVGTGMMCIDASGNLKLDMNGLGLYKVFVGDAAHNQVSGTDFLTFDSGKSAPRNFGGGLENNVNASTEEFGSLDFSMGISTCNPIVDPETGETTGYTSNSFMKDTYVNANFAAIFNSGKTVWLETQAAGDPTFVNLMDWGWDPEVDAGGPYIIDRNQSIHLSGQIFYNDQGGHLAWDLNGDGHTDVTGLNPGLTFDYLTDTLGLSPGNHSISCYLADAPGYYPQDSAYITIVPEPASLALLSLGGLAMLRRRK